MSVRRVCLLPVGEHWFRFRDGRRRVPERGDFEDEGLTLLLLQIKLESELHACLGVLLNTYTSLP